MYAAAQVVFVLMDAHLGLGTDYQMRGPCLPDPPISVSLHVIPSARSCADVGAYQAQSLRANAVASSTHAAPLVGLGLAGGAIL